VIDLGCRFFWEIFSLTIFIMPAGSVITNPEISKLGSMFYKIAFTNIHISFYIFLIFYRKNTKKNIIEVVLQLHVILHIFSIVQSNVHG